MLRSSLPPAQGFDVPHPDCGHHEGLFDFSERPSLCPLRAQAAIPSGEDAEVRGHVAEVSCEQSVVNEYPEPACAVKDILYVDDTNAVLPEEEKNKFPMPYHGKL